MNENQECKKSDQLDPGTKILIGLKKVSEKLVEVSKAMKQLEALTCKLAQVINILAENYAFQLVGGIGDRVEGSEDE